MTSTSRFLLDFEMAAINSVQAAFPNCSISGCFFHLCRCVLRNVASLGLKKEYDSNKDFNLKVKSLMSLSFVPPEDVPTVFDLLSAKYPNTEACDNLLRDSVHMTSSERLIRLWKIAVLSQLNTAHSYYQKTTALSKMSYVLVPLVTSRRHLSRVQLGMAGSRSRSSKLRCGITLKMPGIVYQKQQMLQGFRS